MKISGWLIAISLTAVTSLFAVDELALRLEPALEAITPDGLLAHIKVLASDEFEGRAPGTKGEELSVNYITDQFRKIGLKPGNPDGGYTQEVPLAGIKSEPRMSFAVRDGTIDLKYPDDFIASSARLQPEIKINNSEVVFVGYGVVAPEYGWENYKIDSPNKNADTVEARSWITLDTAKKLLAACGEDFEALKKSAITKEFRPVPINAKANIDIKQQLRSFKSHNVIGKLEGIDPKLRDEYIIYTAHWDHLGLNHNLQGDQIYNGAVDNASGVASLIQLAAAFAKLNPPPKRSVLFMATTAEEAGLLGSKFYALRPLYPLEKTLADINIDTVNPWGKTRDIEDLSNDNSTLDDLLTAAAKRNGRVTQPNSQPEKGGFYRADHFEFTKRGVPSLYTGGGKDFIGKPADFGQQKKDDYIAHHYHQVSDEVNPNWDLSGAVQDIQLLFEVGYQVVNGDKFPEWKPESEFKGKRDEMLKR